MTRARDIADRTFNTDASFGDNDKAIFGDGSDLQIYHNPATGSYIEDAGAGNLILKGTSVVIDDSSGDRMATFVDGGAVSLNFAASTKLATTATGVDVTGTLTADGLTVDGGATNFPITVTSTDQYAGITFVDNTTTSSAVVAIYADGDELGLEAGNAERLRIGSGGQVGLSGGTASFDTTGSVNGLQLHYQTSNGQATIGSYSSGGNTDISFHTNAGGGASTEAMRIDSGGRLIINDNSSGGDSLTVYGKIIGSDQYGIQIRGNANSYNQTAVRFYDSYNTNIVGSITFGTGGTAYNTSSDYRLKENVVADWDATTRLKQLNPVRFNFIADADTTVDGFLAHEVQSVVPEAITGTKDGMRDEEYEVSAATGDIYTPAIEAVLDEDGNEVTAAVAEVIHSTDVERPEELAEGQQWRETTAAVMGTRSVPDYQGIDQSKLVPLLVKTIQELEARITALEAN